MPVILIFCTITVALFIIFELLPLFREKKWKAFWTYLILISLAYINEVLINFGIKLPSPSTPIAKILTFIFRLEE
ncbi:hypothetical protein EHE19_013900 [Ruminiclostridium herbifermentans]|uniref:Uncharacterized protein n=1 Tax=Ruminiclostridium herbifermentans TaxID=2488810 RepID=A0A4U7JH99_9FIRM|nr:hypothetical protein [Ruminiclostridium herbifermentans]QNU65973.1 hypothetical protein EHE19_013900 [Ruminiclostridium herbifermentans]